MRGTKRGRNLLMTALAVLFLFSACGGKGGSSSVMEPHEHTLIKLSARKATCTKEGRLAYWHCEDCGKYYLDAKAAIDKLKTAAQYADEELAEVKAAAIAEMEGYKADVTYLTEQAEARANAILAGKEKVGAATTEEEITAAINEAKAAIDGLAGKDEIVAAAIAEVEDYKVDVVYMDEQAAAKATIVSEAKATIEGATTQAAIDELKTKAEIEAGVLAGQKETANAKVDALKKAIDFDLYEEDGVATINSLYATVKAAIENATTEEEINAAVAEFEAALAEVPQKDNGDTSSEPETSETTSEGADSSVGCFGIASGLPCGIVMLVLAGAVYFKRKEND